MLPHKGEVLFVDGGSYHAILANDRPVTVHLHDGVGVVIDKRGQAPAGVGLGSFVNLYLCTHGEI